MAVVTSSRLLVAAVALSIAYYICLVLYRLFFHPLAKFPGPKLAAATNLYEYYFDVAKRGMFIWEIERMHEKYGMASFIRSQSPYSEKSVVVCFFLQSICSFSAFEPDWQP